MLHELSVHFHLLGSQAVKLESVDIRFGGLVDSDYLTAIVVNVVKSYSKTPVKSSYTFL